MGGADSPSRKEDDVEVLSQAMTQQMKLKNDPHGEEGVKERESRKNEMAELRTSTNGSASGSVYSYYKDANNAISQEMYFNYGILKGDNSVSPKSGNVNNNFGMNIGMNMGNNNYIPTDMNYYYMPPNFTPNNNISSSGNFSTVNNNSNKYFHKQTTPKCAKSTPSPDLNEVLFNILDYCKDHSGSRIVQRKFEEGSEEDKDKIVDILLPNIYTLSKDVFGNYVIQKIFEQSSCSPRKSLIMQKFRGKIYELSLHMYGCRVIQKALEVIDLDDAKLIFNEVKHAIPKFIEDQNGNHVIQKLIERLPREENNEILKVFPTRVFQFAVHQYGCRVLQKIFDYCPPADYKHLIDELMGKVLELVQDQYGNYVIQHIIEKQTNTNSYLVEIIWKELKGKIFDLSIHKYASNAIEKLLAYGGQKIRKEIIEEIITKDDQFSDSLLAMVRDKYGNYVVQKLIEVADNRMKENMVNRIVSSQAMKKRDGFCKLNNNI